MLLKLNILCKIGKNKNKLLTTPSADSIQPTTVFTSHYFESEENSREYLSWLQNKLSIKTRGEWYKITPKMIKENGGIKLLIKYNNSPIEILERFLPGDPWVPWKFKHVPRNYWSSKDNQLYYMEWLRKELDVSPEIFWNIVTGTSLQTNHGGGLLQYYGGSFTKLRQVLSPENDESLKYPWITMRAPKDFWKSKDNRLLYINWLKEKLGITTTQDWGKKITRKSLLNNYGGGILFYYGNSTKKLKMELLPDVKLSDWKYKSKKVWSDDDDGTMVDLFVTAMCEKFNIRRLSDWYNISHIDFINNDGKQLLTHYGSVYSFLQVIPEDSHHHHHHQHRVILFIFTLR
eukprot:TRINITY_DN466_c4_g1_i2.p1 TRINITY_DN466_c4_g1~~TRINITY_DN466_c4_g1_i2.p1  ORF type:complete len:346 (-),score=57.62 TRINITY_DN466_c4_g1_i2:30-1067(-)